ncbi:ABC transporter ATP-binding protein [Phytomonospora endophytica]|uniref:ABC-2 type transport system ATP-binding protein n=1 Tax=Phytomonospora endophytica TaxID=714109 RepID=A0A841FMN8_9ACTN|nr:ATP-binding cassette domain-containing protein [Phytomonospora endophytica]MBB6037114.1 ABC-2 type transport system ATP-binding protein [Phytomonospora endophytica]GIG71153.1 ABC transporter ATP-binding protein [Phytomonospora endophytica]
MIEVIELTKRYGRTLAVDGLSFQVKPGLVTGFLGPNGAGKSTTMRAILGLDAPDSGRALVDGRPYIEIRQPMRVVGALLDASSVHPGRSALNHLRALARTNRIGTSAVVSVMERVGLAGVARKKVGAFSLGMKQRLGIAAALLGDPAVLMFDEPVNGLDPEGVRWIRELMRGLAGDGRTVLVSSHLMSEMQLTADRLVIIGRGKLIEDATVGELTKRFQRGVLVRSPRGEELAAALSSAGATVTPEGGGLSVQGLDVPSIGDLAAAKGIPLHEVTPRGASLEEAYMRLTADSVEHKSAGYKAVAS